MKKCVRKIPFLPNYNAANDDTVTTDASTKVLDVRLWQRKTKAQLPDDLFETSNCSARKISFQTPMFGRFDVVYQPKKVKIGENFSIYQKYHVSEA